MALNINYNSECNVVLLDSCHLSPALSNKDVRLLTLQTSYSLRNAGTEDKNIAYLGVDRGVFLSSLLLSHSSAPMPLQPLTHKGPLVFISALQQFPVNLGTILQTHDCLG